VSVYWTLGAGWRTGCPRCAYDGLWSRTWFQSRNPEIDWSRGQLLGLRTPVGNSGNEQTITSLPQGDWSAEGGACELSPAVYLQFLGAAAFDDLLARDVVAALAIQNDEGTGLLGVSTMSEGVTSWKLGGTSPGRCWMGEQGAAAVVAAEGGPQGNPEWLLPARRDTKGVLGRRGLALLRRTVPIQAPGFSLPPLPSFLSSIWLARMEQIQSRMNPCGSAVGRSFPQTNDNSQRWSAPRSAVYL